MGDQPRSRPHSDKLSADLTMQRLLSENAYMRAALCEYSFVVGELQGRLLKSSGLSAQRVNTKDGAHYEAASAFCARPFAGSRSSVGETDEDHKLKKVIVADNLELCASHSAPAAKKAKLASSSTKPGSDDPSAASTASLSRALNTLAESAGVRARRLPLYDASPYPLAFSLPHAYTYGFPLPLPVLGRAESDSGERAERPRPRAHPSTPFVPGPSPSPIGSEGGRDEAEKGGGGGVGTEAGSTDTMPSGERGGSPQADQSSGSTTSYSTQRNTGSGSERRSWSGPPGYGTYGYPFPYAHPTAYHGYAQPVPWTGMVMGISSYGHRARGEVEGEGEGRDTADTGEDGGRGAEGRDCEPVENRVEEEEEEEDDDLPEGVEFYHPATEECVTTSDPAKDTHTKKGKMDTVEQGKVTDFISRIISGSLIVARGDLACALQDHVNPARPREFYEKLVSRRGMNQDLGHLLAPRRNRRGRCKAVQPMPVQSQGLGQMLVSQDISVGHGGGVGQGGDDAALALNASAAAYAQQQAAAFAAGMLYAQGALHANPLQAPSMITKSTHEAR